MAQGNIATALKEPNTIVLSKTAAEKYFGTADVIGKTLLINNDTTRPCKITGILAELPGNLHFNFDFYSHYQNNPDRQTWSNVGSYTYLKLKPGTDIKKLEAKFPALVAAHVVPEIQRDMGVSLAEAQKSVNSFVFYLKPIDKIHLHSANKDELQPNGSIKYVYIFGALALFIIILAAVNFTNLSTAVSIQRSKEVGMRKVMGSGKKQLVLQFLSESILLSFFAYIIALGFIYLALPSFNDLSGKQLFFTDFINYKSILVSLVFVFVIGILAGVYPAFFLSSFNIISVLKGKKNTTPKSSRYLRSGLVVFQFAVSIALIICTVIVYKQLHFMQNKELGFDKTQSLVINDTYLIGKNQPAFKQQLLQDSRVVSATLTRDVPVGTHVSDGTQAFSKEAADNGTRAEIHINKYYVDYDYIKTLGMHMKAGRFFSPEFADSAAVILNEAAVKEFGIAGDPVGQSIITSGQHQYNIIGVVNDFHYASVKEKIAPLTMMLGRNMGGLIVKIKTAGLESLLSSFENTWNSFNPAGPFSYNFMDDKFEAVYKTEKRTGKIFSVFAIISIIIASLGLFGLSAYSIALRTKEIGVRKVMGASVSQVVLLLSKDFLLMVLIAFVVAVPVTWLAMHKWLEEFAYRINIGWAVFALAGLAAVLIAFTTVSFQAIKASITNPVKSLRSE
ncbi:MAG: FtsX-like permease family protein [Sphingobacteriales bacterium]|nr:MAG: FtsX-like permease family protein [Sphingobacteriales bacterium]